MTPPTPRTAAGQWLRDHRFGMEVEHDDEWVRRILAIEAEARADAAAIAAAYGGRDGLHTDEEYIEYGVQQYRRGKAQAEYEATHGEQARAALRQHEEGQR